MKTSMRKRVALSAWLFAATVLLWTTSSAYAQEAPPQSDKAKEVVALVEKPLH